MTYEHPISDGFTVQHYGAHDWFPVMGAGWWVREWLMCDEKCEIHVYDDDDNGVSWGEVVDMLRALGDTGPYGDGPVFAELTYNRENNLDNELLIAAGWIDVSKYALHRGLGSPLLRAVKEQHPEHDWDEIGRVYIVAIAYGGCYGHPDAIADVYLSPNIDDDYDVARWQVQMYASETAPTSYRGFHPIYDASGGWGDRIPGLGDTSGYPYGQNEDRLPMYDVSDVTWDPERGCHEDGSGDILPATMAGTADGYLTTYSGPWLACGSAGVFAVGTDGRVYVVSAGVN